MEYLDRHSVAALGGDDAVVAVVVDLVVVDGQEVAVVVGVKAVLGVVVHLVPPPVSLLVAVRVHPEMVVVDVRVINVTVDVNHVENFRVALVRAEPSDLSSESDMTHVREGRFQAYKQCACRISISSFLAPICMYTVPVEIFIRPTARYI